MPSRLTLAISFMCRKDIRIGTARGCLRMPCRTGMVTMADGVAAHSSISGTFLLRLLAGSCFMIYEMVCVRMCFREEVEAQNANELGGEYFDPQFLQVDRLIASRMV